VRAQEEKTGQGVVVTPSPRSTRLGRTAGSLTVVSDVVRFCAGLSVGLAASRYGFVPTALFALVLGGTMLPRMLGGIGGVFDLAYTSLILAAGWAAVFDLYRQVPLLDLAVHALTTGAVAVLGHAWLVRMAAVPTVDDPPARALGTAVLVSGMGTGISVLWELGEWFGHTFLDDRIQVGYADTVADLASGGVGAVVAGLLLATGGPRGRGASG